jgi:hypothetical protein
MAAELDELIHALANGTRPVVAIIGAGVSYAATRAPSSLWLGLLLDGLCYCAASQGLGRVWLDEHEAALNRAKDAGQIQPILGIADVIVSKLGGEEGRTSRYGWPTRLAGSVPCQTALP